MEISRDQISIAIQYAKQNYPDLLLDKFDNHRKDVEAKCSMFMGLGIEELFELREYCGGQISYLGDAYSRYKYAEDAYLSEYKTKIAEVKLGAIKNGESASKASIIADVNEAKLKLMYNKTHEMRQRIGKLLSFVEQRDDSIKQYISFLKQEKNRTQFIG